MKFLLIDDDTDDQVLFSDAVRKLIPEIEIDIAENGLKGLQSLNTCPELPRMVFLDINMPLMDGRETLLAIRQSPFLRRLNVVVYSTSINEHDAVRFDSLNARGIVKPNSFGQLVDILHMELVHQGVLQPGPDSGKDNYQRRFTGSFE